MMSLSQRRAVLECSVAVIDFLELFGDAISGNALYNATLGGIPLVNSADALSLGTIQYVPASFNIAYPGKSATKINDTGSTTISGINPLIYSAMVKSGTGVRLVHKQAFYDFASGLCDLWRLAEHKVVSCSNNSFKTTVSGILSDSLNTELGRIKFSSFHFPNIFNSNG